MARYDDHDPHRLDEPFAEQADDSAVRPATPPCKRTRTERMRPPAWPEEDFQPPVDLVALARRQRIHRAAQAGIRDADAVERAAQCERDMARALGFVSVPDDEPGT